MSKDNTKGNKRKERIKKTSEERQVQREQYRKKRMELLNELLREGQGEPTPQEKKLILNYLGGMPKKKAAEEAGLTKKAAFGKHGIIKRPRVQSFLTDALEKAGLTTDSIAKILIDAMSATSTIVSSQGEIVADVPDHRTRLGAYDRIVDAYGVGGQQRIDPKDAQRQEGLTVHFHLTNGGTDNKNPPPKDVTPASEEVREAIAVQFQEIAPIKKQ